MLKIEDGVIYLTRGDDATIDVQMNNLDGDIYYMQPQDTLTLTVRGAPSEDSPIVFSVNSISGSNQLIINSSDTANAAPGQYSADIQLTTQDSKRYTVWPDLEGNARYRTSNIKNFVIMPEVTMQ